MARIKEKPYIGVSGINSPYIAQKVAGAFQESGLDTSPTRQGMVGILTSPETTIGESRGGRYPQIEKIRSLLEVTRPVAFNTLHHFSPRAEGIADQVASILWNDSLYADDICRGVQLNARWPLVRDLIQLKSDFPELKVILQIGPRILQNDPVDVIGSKFSQYRGLIDYALIDPSGGVGQFFSINEVAATYTALKNANPDATLGFAGGLHSGNVVARCWELFQMTASNDFSIDAENGLRVKSRKHRITADLSPQRTRNYILSAADYFKEFESNRKD